MSHNDCEGRVELDHLHMLVVKRADATNGELVKRRPGSQRLSNPDKILTLQPSSRAAFENVSGVDARNVENGVRADDEHHRQPQALCGTKYTSRRA